MKTVAWKNNLITITVLLICAVPLFLNLGAKPIELWDESRNACNAIEMYQNHNFIVRHFNGSPDMWEVKPPLLIWLQVASMWIFGINEFAIRFPIAISILCLLGFIMLFLKKEFDSPYPGIIACLVFITSKGVIERHIGRTGDHDGILILWTTLTLLTFFKYCESGTTKHLIYTIVFITLSVLTKSIMGLFMLPMLFVYAVYKKKIISIVRNPYFYISTLGFIVIISTYYFLREKMSPGYLETVWKEELYVRYSNNGTFQQVESFWYYLKNFKDDRFVPWLYLLPLSIPAYFLLPTKRLKDLMLLLLTTSIFLFFVISKGSKNLWYDAMMYPLMSMILGISIWAILDWIYVFPKREALVFTAIIAILFIDPYSKVIKKAQGEECHYRLWEGNSISFYLKERLHLLQKNNSITLCFNNYHAHLLFYKHLLEMQGYKNIVIKNSVDIAPNETVIVAEQEAKDYVASHFTFELKDSHLFADRILITGKKK